MVPSTSPGDGDREEEESDVSLLEESGEEGDRLLGGGDSRYFGTRCTTVSKEYVRVRCEEVCKELSAPAPGNVAALRR